MKKIVYMLLFILIFLTWCWKNNEEPINNQINIDSNDIQFKFTSIERIHDYLSDKEKIKFEIPEKSNFNKDYFYSKIKIQETIFTGCVSSGWLKYDWFNQYIDQNNNCPEIGYKIIIPWGIFDAYIPKNKKVTNCSISNPIVCRNENINEQEVIEYYNKHKECPSWFIYSSAWIKWPTASCDKLTWFCHRTTCGYKENWKWRTCDLEKHVRCWWERSIEIKIGDPCDFFLWMWMVPADGSCDEKLNNK